MTKPFGDRFDRRLTGGGLDDDVADLIVARCGHLDAVDLQEDGGWQPAETFVAIDERMVCHDRMEQRSGFGPDVGVSVFAER